METISLLNRNIEENALKQEVREDILEQIGHLVPNGRYSKLDVFTLPGEQCILENMIADQYAESKVILNINCAENDPKKIVAVRSNLPKQASVDLGDVDDVICKSIRTGKGREYDIIWIDYCCAANPILISRIAKYFQLCLKPIGLIYVTFYIRGDRHKDVGGKSGLARLAQSGTILPTPNCKLPRAMNNKELKCVILREIQKSFNASNIKLNKIYDVIYGGGSRQAIPMVTLGFSKGIRKQDANYFRPICQDRIARERSVKRKRTLKKRAKKKITILFEQGATTEEIKKICKLTGPQVAAYRAHYNKRNTAWHKADRVEDGGE